MFPLRKRFQRSPARANGFSLVEALVSSFLLMLAVSQSLSIFGTTLSAMGKSRLRDSLNAAIHADLEAVRNQVADWALETPADGLTSYAPDSNSCDSNQLATALLDDKRAESTPQLVASTTLDLTASSIPTPGLAITRTIKPVGTADKSSGDGNLLEVDYSTNTNRLISIKRKSILMIPAQGWCS